jgi:DNA-binding NtrC family response regulator
MKNILIVEDEKNVRESLRDWLVELGCQVAVTSNGEEALKQIYEKEFDAVILDLRLPGKDGLQVLKEARLKKPQLNGIIITAYPTAETMEEAMEIGAVDFLSKPINLPKLENLIQEKTDLVKLKMKPILIVDDEASMRESLRDWFLEAGYQAETARDGEEALKLIGEKNYGLLILDLKLPGLDGIEVLKKARKSHPDLRGIIITAYPSVDTAREAIKQGAIDYLPKPFALSELEKLVEENIEPSEVQIMRHPIQKHAVAAILKVLTRAAEDSEFVSRLAENPEETLAEYTDLSAEEKEALIDGDIKTIETWVGKLDQQKATWLWCRLSQEKW